MNKNEFWQTQWIHIRERVPPAEDYYILIWNPQWEVPFVMKAYEAHQAGLGVLKNEWVTQDRYFTHWIKIHPPIKRNKSRRTK